MDVNEVIQTLKVERDRIEATIAILEGSAGSSGGSALATKAQVAPTAGRRRRRISAEGLARMRAAQKLRWAKFRKAGK